MYFLIHICISQSKVVFQTSPYWPLFLPYGATTGQNGSGCARSLELLIGYTKPSGTQTSVCPPSWSLNQPPSCNKQSLLCLLCAANRQNDGVCRLLQSSSLQPVTVGLDSAWPNDLAEINCCQRMVPQTSSSQGQVVWAVHSKCGFKFITGLCSTCYLFFLFFKLLGSFWCHGSWYLENMEKHTCMCIWFVQD